MAFCPMKMHPRRMCMCIALRSWLKRSIENKVEITLQLYFIEDYRIRWEARHLPKPQTKTVRRQNTTGEFGALPTNVAFGLLTYTLRVSWTLRPLRYSNYSSLTVFRSSERIHRNAPAHIERPHREPCQLRRIWNPSVGRAAHEFDAYGNSTSSLDRWIHPINNERVQVV